MVIIIGTGRCGTKSLAQILNRQEGVVCTHELKPVLPWHFGQIAIDNRIEELEMSDGIVGDAGFYYLNYVEYLFKETDVKFVCLKRDREGTVNSFLRKVGNRNHWMEHDGTYWSYDKRWDKTFPKYDVNDRATAIGMYWDDYYAKIEELKDKYPIKIVRTKELSNLDSVMDILKFCEIPNPKPINLHKNREQ